MKRLIAIIMLVCMGAVFACPILAVDVTWNKSEIKTVESIIDVPVGKKVNATFVCKSAENDIKLKADDGVIAQMNDTGRNGDSKKADGISSANVTLYSDERGVYTYTAVSDNDVLTTYTVNFYNELTNSDFEVKEEIDEAINEIEAANEGRDKECIFDEVQSYLETRCDVEDIVRTKSSISYTTIAGITSAYTIFSSETKGSEQVAVNAASGEMDFDIASEDELLSYTNPNVMLLRPFRNDVSEEADGFHHDYYTKAIKCITNVTDGETFIFDDDEANPYNIIDNIDKVGFFFIDTHGIDLNVGGSMGSFMVLKNANNDGITSADWNAGRVVDLNRNNLIAVSGEYIKAHYLETNRRLENTFCYLGLCLGMKYDTIYEPLTELGARFVVGYDETVSIWYDSSMLNEIAKRFAKTSDQNPERTYSALESIEYAKTVCGQQDPYFVGAKAKSAGSDMALVLPDNGATELTLPDSSIDATENRVSIIPMTVKAGSNEAHGYTQEWESSDTSVVRIIGPRAIKGVSEGTATVTCTVKSGSRTLTESCEVNVKFIGVESVKVQLTNSNMVAGDTFSAICTVYPRTASYRDYTLHSTNEGAVTIKDKNITAVAPGKSLIWAETSDPDVTGFETISVSTRKALKSTSSLSGGNNYALAFAIDDRNLIIEGRESSGYLYTDDISVGNGYISSAITTSRLWSVESAVGGVYLRSNKTGLYLSHGSGDKVAFTEAPETVFTVVGKKIKDATSESDSCYLKYKSGKGIYFGSKASAVEIGFFKLLDFNDEEQFKIVTFEGVDDMTYTQHVEKGMNAEAINPMRKAGKTFVGWDKPLAKVNESFTTKAIYKDGDIDADKVLITFMYTDGTVIAEQLLNKGDRIQTPEADAYRNGCEFIGWSEDLYGAEYNMTVFALYNDSSVTPPSYVKGDLTGDGLINTGDAVLVLRYAAELTTLTSQQEQAGDVTGDGTINTGDAVMILRFAAGLINEF